MEIDPFDDDVPVTARERRAGRRHDEGANRKPRRTIVAFATASLLVCAVVVAGAMSRFTEHTRPTTPAPSIETADDLGEHPAAGPSPSGQDAVVMSGASNSEELGQVDRSDCTGHLGLSAAVVGVDPLFWTFGVVDAIARTGGTLDAEILQRLHAVQTLTPPTRENLRFLDGVDSAIAEMERHPCPVASSGA